MTATPTKEDKEVGYVKSFAYKQEVSNSDGGEELSEKLDKILEELSWLRAEVKVMRMMQDERLARTPRTPGSVKD
jgi:hypothetical protein